MLWNSTHKLETIETFIDFKKLQLLGQLCRLPCRHLSKSVLVHRLASFMNGDKQRVGFIPDIYKLLDNYQLVGYNLTFLKDALFPSNSVWRAILRQQVLQSNIQTMKQELMHNGNGCRPMLSVQTEYPTYGVSVGIHPLFHQYAENYYV